MEDKDVIKLTLGEDSQHYTLLVKKYGEFLFGLGMRLTRGNKFLTEEIIQDTFLKSFKYLHSFDVKKSYKKWLLSIFYNNFKDAIKKDIIVEELDENRDYNKDIEPNYSGFFDLIKPLNADEKTVFSLKYIYGYTSLEIFEITKIKERQIKELIKNGKSKINGQI